MGILHYFKPKKNQILEDLLRIKAGDALLREKVISDYRPFVIKVVSQVTGKYVEIENSEEYSIGLIAFNDAIDSYNPNKNNNFFSYSELIIKRKIIDYIRVNQKNKNVYPFSTFDIEDNDYSDGRNQLADSFYQLENIEFQEQMTLFINKLGEFGISLKDVALNSPKHKDSICLATKIGRVLAENDDLYSKLVKTKNLPTIDLLKVVNVHRKTIEKHRKYIIAVSLILRSDLEDLDDYIRQLEKGGR